MFPKRGAAALAITTVALILLLSFKTPDQVVPNVNGSTGAAEVAPSATIAPDTTTTTPDTTTTTPAPAAQDATTVTGPVVDTQFGPVQVEITVNGGSLTDVTALQLPTGGHSGRISQRAESVLRSEALQAKSANIDTVSGATYTSMAYAQSLQAALDQAGI
jgi:uncharacterized protein with FMN-binding domain